MSRRTIGMSLARLQLIFPYDRIDGGLNQRKHGFPLLVQLLPISINLDADALYQRLHTSWYLRLCPYHESDYKGSYSVQMVPDVEP